MSKDKLALVYAHINLVNGKKYFGITTNPTNERWGSAGGGYGNNKHFTNAIKYYGWDNFGHYVLFENIPIDMAKRIENILVDEHMTHDPRFGYNKTHGGELEIPSKETCDKISAGLKEYYENHPEAREAISVATKEAMKRPDVRQKIIDAHKGKPLSEKHRRKISDGLKGHEISEETRNKISNTHKKPVEAINPKTGLPSLYFDSAMSAGRLGFSNKKISKCCLRKQKTHKGYEWRFVKEVNDDDSDN